MYRTLLIDVQNSIATVIINRPDKLNALNAEAKAELRSAFSEFKVDNEVHVVILTGAGDKAFVAGTDIGELTQLTRETGEKFSAGGQALLNEIESLDKPVIAAVNGYALGGGCELAMATHIRIASDHAKFGQPELNLGIIPGYGGTQRLVRLVGPGKATEMILTGVQVDANEALRIGLADKVVPHAELMTQANHTARVITSMSQVSVRAALKAIRAAMLSSLAEGLVTEAALFGQCCASQDFKEGTVAFLEKRKPSFRNS